LEFKILSKKVCFLSFELEKNKFHHFWPPWKKFGKSPSGPLWKKILPTPMYGPACGYGDGAIWYLSRGI